MSYEKLAAFVQTDAFLTFLLLGAGILVTMNFLQFVVRMWREGQYPMLKPCSDCGNANSYQATACPGCGKPLQPAGLPAETPTPSTSYNGRVESHSQPEEVGEPEAVAT